MTPLKILFIHEFFDNIAGQELSLLDRLTGLREAGIECAVLLPGEGMFTQLLRTHDIPVILFKLTRLSKATIGGYFKTIGVVRRIIEQGHFTIAHCSGAYPCQYVWPASFLASIPCIVHINSLVYTREVLWKNAVPMARHIITVSDAVREAVKKTIPSASAKIVAVHDAITLKEILEPSVQKDIKARLKIADGTITIGQVGSILPLKGIEVFIEMAALLKTTHANIKFLLIGRVYDQAYLTKIMDKIEALSLKEDIIFTGFVTEVEQYIDILDVNVLATLSEGLGRVLVQAQLLGKAVIATDIDGCREVIEQEKTGLLVPVNDAASLANAVMRVLDDPILAQDLGERARKEAQYRFSLKRHVSHLMTVYQKALS